jgi:16S rRNA G966 N2-methylase RsmD
VQALFFSIVLLAHSGQCAAAANQSAVLCDYNDGRLGNHLATYWHAKVFAEAYKLPLLYEHIPGITNLLTLDIKNKQAQFKAAIKKFKNVVYVKEKYQFPNALNPSDSTLYCISIRMQVDKLLKLHEKTINYEKIRQEYKLLITPPTQLAVTIPQHNQMTVALHVRRGGGFDKPLLSKKIPLNNSYSDIRFPLKFPPLSYYIEQIKTLWHMVGRQPLYIYLFTDDQSPSELINAFKNALPDLPLTFATRLEDNAHDANIIDDMFAMTQCDCLIRPDSSYSKTAGLIGDHLIVISPTKSHWENQKLIIDAVNIVDRRAQSQSEAVNTRSLVKDEALAAQLRYITKMLDEGYYANLFMLSINDCPWLKQKSFSPNGGAANTSFLYRLFKVLELIKPTSILELGIGQSTKLTAQYIAYLNKQAHLHVIESDQQWLALFAEALPHHEHIHYHQLSTEIRSYSSHTTRAYKNFIQALPTATSFDFVIIDGPMGSTHYSRTNVLDLVEANKLAESFIIILDDYDRQGEQHTAEELIKLLTQKKIPFQTKTHHGIKTQLLIFSPKYAFIGSV